MVWVGESGVGSGVDGGLWFMEEGWDETGC